MREVIVDKRDQILAGDGIMLQTNWTSGMRVSEQSRVFVSERSGGLYFFVLYWWAKLPFFCRLVEPCELVDIVWDSVWKKVNKATEY